MADIGCHEIITGYELVVVECDTCKFHLGLDGSYIEQVGAISVLCPCCAARLHVGDGEDDSMFTKEKAWKEHVSGR